MRNIYPDLRCGFRSGSRPTLNSVFLWSLPPYSPKFIKIRPVVYKKFCWQTTKQTKKWHSDSADPAKALRPSDILDRNPVVELWPVPKLSISRIMTEFLAVLSQKICFRNWNKILATQRFAHSTLAFSAQCSNRVSYSAVLFWLLL